MADEHLSESQLRQMERMTSDTFICDVVGVRLTQFDAGRATVELTLTDRHLNGVGICYFVHCRLCFGGCFQLYGRPSRFCRDFGVLLSICLDRENNC